MTACLAMTREVETRGLHADMTAGLSLGEYCAIAVAGGMSDMDAIRTVRARGIYMENAAPAGSGAMAAVLGMEASVIEDTIKDIDGVSIANYNCPGQIVITGEAKGVQKASEALKEAGARRVLPLNVSGPFHSPMMVPAGEKLKEVLDGTTTYGASYSLCGQCKRQSDRGFRRDKRSSCEAGKFFRSLGTEHGDHDPGRCGYFRGDRSGKDACRFYAQDQQKCKNVSYRYLGRGRKSLRGADWKRRLTGEIPERR